MWADVAAVTTSIAASSAVVAAPAVGATPSSCATTSLTSSVRDGVAGWVQQGQKHNTDTPPRRRTFHGDVHARVREDASGEHSGQPGRAKGNVQRSHACGFSGAGSLETLRKQGDGGFRRSIQTCLACTPGFAFSFESFLDNLTQDVIGLHLSVAALFLERAQ
eukprot:m.367017 g.367017  ORF g.367017 m.367017 type:complete len:163 (-) comp16661_c1_seq8:2183-2671(-)